MFNEEETVKKFKFRTDFIGNIVLFSFFIILARLWFLQIYQGERFYKFSIENRLRKEIIKAPRGMIFGRDNELLINNAPRFDVAVIPQYLKEKKETFKKLSQILDIPVANLNKIIRKNRGQASYRPIVVKKNISLREVAIIETENYKLPGVRVQTFISREYQDGEVGAHLLGYISEINQKQLPKYRKRDNYNYKLGDFIGQAGIEEKFDLLLRGDDGYEFVEVDARGRKRNVKSNLLFAGIKNKKSKPGHNIRLTIDRDMQIQAFKSLEGKVGSVVSVDIETGEILTMVSRPSFDPESFSRGIKADYWKSLVNDSRNPLIDRTIQEHYNPGSTFKTITSIAALEENLVKADQEFLCGGTFRLGRRVYHDWRRGGHGWTDVYKALKRSVDVYFYKIGTQLDIDVLAKYARMFGLGSKTGISLSREIPGLIPTREWKKKRFGEAWQAGETLSCVIGQSYVLTTPLQLVMSYAAIANQGKLMKPLLIKEIFSNDGDIIKTYKPEMVSKADIKPRTLRAITKGLYQVVNEPRGTAYWARGKGLLMAGKTGTSQVKSMTKKELFSKCSEMPYESRHHALFVAFAPYDNPKVATVAAIEHGCSGSGAAAPVVRDVMTTYMNKHHPELVKKNSEIEKRNYLRYKRKQEEKKRLEEKRKVKEQQEQLEVG